MYDKNSCLNKTNDVILPLHPNHRLLYETILQLNPRSLEEIGCGCGDHLYNLGVLSPEINLSGIELSAAQIKFFKKRHPNLRANISQYDSTLLLGGNNQSFDIAFTQAVIMHIKTADKHLIALQNLFKLASKQVVLMENWKTP